MAVDARGGDVELKGGARLLEEAARLLRVEAAEPGVAVSGDQGRPTRRQHAASLASRVRSGPMYR